MRGAPRLREFDRLFSPSRRLAARLGGGLHGGGRQLLHRVSEPAPRPHLTRSCAALAGSALGVCVAEGGGLGDGRAPGLAAPQGAWPGPARPRSSQQTLRLPGHAYPQGMRWAQWRVSESGARVGLECGLRAWAWGRGKRARDASGRWCLATLAGIA